MHNDIKLIAFDLDFTLLDSKKCISEENMNVLKRAKADGIELVTSTGRLYDNIYPEIKELCRYFILTNGATAYDSKEDKYLFDCNIPNELAIKILDFGDTLPVIYDSYTNNVGYMSQSMWEVLEEYMPDQNYAKTMKAKRTPVPDMKQMIIDNKYDPQKLQFYFKDYDLRDKICKQLGEMYDGALYTSTSLASNIEINLKDAVKGVALKRLCKLINIPIENTIGIGDGTNDFSLIRDSGIGICMCNGAPECKAVADIITEYDCENSGMGREIAKILNYQ